MAYNSVLNFDLDGQTVDEMIDEIVEKRKKYNELKTSVKDRCRGFTRIMAVNFVYQSNKAECVGTQTFDGTRKLLDRYLTSEVGHQEDDSALSESDRGSVNNWRALRESFYGPSDEESSGDHDWEKLRESGLLTVPVVCDLHAILLKGLKTDDGGQIRKKTGNREGEVYVEYQGKLHTYPSPEVVEHKLYNIVDRHNIHMKGIKKQTTSRENTIYIFKCAAWLLYEVVSLHPFYDGNGRICRLLANHVLSLITPFPVTIYHKNSADRNRDVYIQAIIYCRENPDKGPGKLAAMLIEGANIGWKELFRYLESGGLLAGPIVIEKSSKSDIPNKVERFCRCKNIPEEAKSMLASVLAAVESADTSCIISDQGQFLEIKLDFNDMCVQLHVYP